jgi:hypothetical protein
MHIYCRISTKSQENGVSLDAQESHMISIADQLGSKIHSVNKVVSSAYKQTPKGIDNYVNCKNDNFMFYSVDRFSRNLEIGKTTAMELIKNGNTLYFVRERIKLTNTNDDEWIKFIKYLEHAQLESDNIRDRVLLSQRYKSNGVNSSNDIIWQLIDCCKKRGTTARKLNAVLHKCNVPAKCKIILGDDGYSSKFLETDMSFSSVADILNDFSIGNRQWSAASVSKYYKKFK